MIEFNKFQQDVIELSSGKHSCMASAGSGKTEVLTERLQRALLEGEDPERILCITFTNRAALSMLKRIRQKLPSEKLENVFVGNTHALALNLLNQAKYFPYTHSLCTPDVTDDLWLVCEKRISQKLKKIFLSKFDENLKEISLDRKIQREIINNLLNEPITEEDLYPLRDFLLTSKDTTQFFKPDLQLTIAESLGIRYHLVPDLESVKSKNPSKIRYFQIYSILKPILEEAIKSEDLKMEYIQFSIEKLLVLYSDTDLSNFMVTLSTMLKVTILIANEYERLKKQLIMYDFDDALCSSLQLQPRNFSWIQIDEFQDLSPIQWLIIKHHMVKDAHLLMFGDINQSIYRFLGASIETTSKELGRSNYELPVNYRSPKNLVDFFKTYMTYNFPNRFQSEINSSKNANPNALIHVECESQDEQNERLLKHAVNLVNSEKNTALLCPTNALVDETSDFFYSVGINHFRISQNDILTSKNALDFFAFLRSFHDKNDHLAWARLLWNLGNVGSYESVDKAATLPPRLHALLIVSQLVQNGGALSDLAAGKNIYDHLFSRMNNAFINGYTFFDTETTGLNTNDNIIQIAGVNVIRGKFSGELDLYCLSDKSVGESERIHNISDEFLELNGFDFLLQSNKFMEFSNGKTLIAHNLEFDERMMQDSLVRTNSINISRFKESPKLCSLNLARRLFPNLKSHKLGQLLKEFNLDGVNSHNALDDVRAGANFIEFIRKEVSERTVKLDEFIDSYASIFNLFREKLCPLYETTEKLNDELDLEFLFDFYFNHVRENKLHDINETMLSELRFKLIRWSSRNFKPNTIKCYLNEIIPHLKTLKESDLITDDDKLVVSTIHKSKGLEFDYVIMPSVVDATYPAYPIKKMKNIKEKEMLIQEQKRLLYVGMTRAKKQLVMGTYRRYLNRYGQEYFTFPCSFMGSMFKLMTRY